MALYVDEEEVWKCPKHPSKRRRTGICHVCLRDRLSSLCPDCANVRPCGCCATTTSSSSSSSSSFSRFSNDVSSLGSIRRVSNVIDSEPSFRRSRSLAIPFLRSRSRFVGDRDSDSIDRIVSPATSSRSSVWSMFKLLKSKKREGEKVDVEGEGELRKREDEKFVEVEEINLQRTTMMRSRSVAVSESDAGYLRSQTKSRRWHFPSPINAFRRSRISKIVHERSPMHRG